MNSREIIRVLNMDIPEWLQDSWDNSGLQVEGAIKEVKKLYIAMDLTDSVIEQAKRIKADMIITHHPLIFSSLKRITNDDFIQGRVIELIKNDIVYYAMHTNFDKVYMGEIAANKINIIAEENLENTGEFNNIIVGYGKVGKLEQKCTVSHLCELIKEKFNLPNVKVFGDGEKIVSKVAIMPGSGKSFINSAIEKKVEVLITGDIDHHAGIDAVAQNLIVIDAGHYGIEHIFIEFMRQYINEKIVGVEVFTEDIMVPFKVV